MDNFEKLVEQYEPLIYKVMNSLNVFANRDEFYQIGLIALWEASVRFDESKGNFLNFAYSYVKGRMMTEMTRENKHTDKCIYPDESFWSLIEDDANCERPLELQYLLAHCDGLTDREKKWVVYNFYYQMKQSEIAPLEGVTTHAVQRWRREALRKLRDKYCN